MGVTRNATFADVLRDDEAVLYRAWVAHEDPMRVALGDASWSATAKRAAGALAL